MRLSRKLFLAFLLTGTLPLILTAWTALSNSQAALREEAQQKLAGLAASKGAEIDRYFDGIRDQILTFSNNRMVVRAMRDFRSAFRDFRKEHKSGADAKKIQSALTAYYRDEFDKVFQERNDGKTSDWSRYMSMLDEDSILFQYAFIAANPEKLGEKHLV